MKPLNLEITGEVAERLEVLRIQTESKDQAEVIRKALALLEATAQGHVKVAVGGGEVCFSGACDHIVGEWNDGGVEDFLIRKTHGYEGKEDFGKEGLLFNFCPLCGIRLPKIQ